MRRQSGGGGATTSRWDDNTEELTLLRLEVERLRLHVPACRRIPKLLVLDLNGLLVHRIFLGEGAYANADAASAVPNVSSTWQVNNFLVYERPHVRDFLRFCLDNFFVGVWTTASANNATPLLEGLLAPEDIAKLVFVWDGKKCTYNGETDPTKPGKPIAFKELPRLWESRDVAGLFGPTNTLLIDDSHYKASLNPPHTAIHPAAWDDPEGLAADDALGPAGKLRVYLESLLLAETSIPEFVAAVPFDAFAAPRAAAPLTVGTNIITLTTPQDDFHTRQEQGQAPPKGDEDEDEDEGDDIVLVPAMAGMSLRLA